MHCRGIALSSFYCYPRSLSPKQMNLMSCVMQNMTESYLHSSSKESFESCMSFVDTMPIITPMVVLTFHVVRHTATQKSCSIFRDKLAACSSVAQHKSEKPSGVKLWAVYPFVDNCRSVVMG